jgi:hypothetical protein
MWRASCTLPSDKSVTFMSAPQPQKAAATPELLRITPDSVSLFQGVMSLRALGVKV